MRSLCLNVELEGHQHQTIDVTHEPEEETPEMLGTARTNDEKPMSEDDLLGSITAELGDLMGGTSDKDSANDLIGKGEEM